MRSGAIFTFPHRKVKFDKLSFFPDGALGCYYGSQFEVHRQQLVLVQENETQSEGNYPFCDSALTYLGSKVGAQSAVMTTEK